MICELEHPLKPGQFAAAEYLAGLIRLTMSRRGHREKTYKKTLYQMIDGMIRGKEFSPSEIEKRIAQCRWKMDDPYVCIRMDAEEWEGSPSSSASVCSYVEAKVAGSLACYDSNRICIIINLSMNDHYTSDIAGILRDGLLKPVSAVCFMNLPVFPIITGRLPWRWNTAGSGMIPDGIIPLAILPWIISRILAARNLPRRNCALRS